MSFLYACCHLGNKEKKKRPPCAIAHHGCTPSLRMTQPTSPSLCPSKTPRTSGPIVTGSPAFSPSPVARKPGETPGSSGLAIKEEHRSVTLVIISVTVDSFLERRQVPISSPWQASPAFRPHSSPASSPMTSPHPGWLGAVALINLTVRLPRAGYAGPPFQVSARRLGRENEQAGKQISCNVVSARLAVPSCNAV